jgi:hypothetical protein
LHDGVVMKCAQASIPLRMVEQASEMTPRSPERNDSLTQSSEHGFVPVDATSPERSYVGMPIDPIELRSQGHTFGVMRVGGISVYSTDIVVWVKRWAQSAIAISEPNDAA